MAANPSPNRWLIRLQQGASVLFFFYVLALLGHSAWQNTQSNHKLGELKGSIQNLETNNQRLDYLKTYLQTNSYRELEARQDLKIKRPGEIVIALPDEPQTGESIATSNPKTPAKPTTAVFLQAWWNYFFEQPV